MTLRYGVFTAHLSTRQVVGQSQVLMVSFSFRGQVTLEDLEIATLSRADASRPHAGLPRGLVAALFFTGIAALDFVFGRLIVAHIALQPAQVVAGFAGKFGGGFDFNIIPGGNELSSQSKRFSLQNRVDQGNGLGRLFFGSAMRDLAGVKLEGQPVNSDGLHCNTSRSQCRQMARDEWLSLAEEVGANVRARSCCGKVADLFLGRVWPDNRHSRSNADGAPAAAKQESRRSIWGEHRIVLLLPTVYCCAHSNLRYVHTRRKR